MKSPVPTISCRSLQHKCFVHVVKTDESFPCSSMTKNLKNTAQVSPPPPPICLCVWGLGVGVGVGWWMHVCRRRQTEPEREIDRQTERKKGRGPEGL